MASNTKQVQKRRAIKKANLGKKRKNHDQKHGTTLPPLPLNKPNAAELAQKAAMAG